MTMHIPMGELSLIQLFTHIGRQGETQFIEGLWRQLFRADLDKQRISDHEPVPFPRNRVQQLKPAENPFHVVSRNNTEPRHEPEF